MQAPMSQEDQIVAALRQIAQAIDTRSRQLLAECGLSAPQIGTLRELARSGGCSPTELADALHLSPQTMAGILQRLEQRGLVGRERDPNDKRSFVVRLSGPNARDVLAKGCQLDLHPVAFTTGGCAQTTLFHSMALIHAVADDKRGSHLALTLARLDRLVRQSGLPEPQRIGLSATVRPVEDVAAFDLARIGPLLENHPIFPERANISLAHVTSPSAITLRTWERGAGLTKACGSAACAAAVCAARRGLTGRQVTVTLPGGPLDIDWRADDRIVMTGPVAMEHEGVLDLAPTAV